MNRKEMTRHMMKEALLRLLQRESFEDITVKQLTAEAHITRSTFYLHYTNIIDIVDELVIDAIHYVPKGIEEPSNLMVIVNALNRATNIDELRQAYTSIVNYVPVCQRVAAEPKYIPLFKSEAISEYVLKMTIASEKKIQSERIAKQLNVPLHVGESVFLFLVQGLYAINKQYNWERTDQWLEAQRTIFNLVYKGFYA